MIRLKLVISTFLKLLKQCMYVCIYICMSIWKVKRFWLWVQVFVWIYLTLWILHKMNGYSKEFYIRSVMVRWMKNLLIDVFIYRYIICQNVYYSINLLYMYISNPSWVLLLVCKNIYIYHKLCFLFFIMINQPIWIYFLV